MSIPIVVTCITENSSPINWDKRLDFPTCESPISIKRKTGGHKTNLILLMVVTTISTDPQLMRVVALIRLKTSFSTRGSGSESHYWERFLVVTVIYSLTSLHDQKKATQINKKYYLPKVGRFGLTNMPSQNRLITELFPTEDSPNNKSLSCLEGGKTSCFNSTDSNSSTTWVIFRANKPQLCNTTKKTTCDSDGSLEQGQSRNNNFTRFKSLLSADSSAVWQVD